MFMDGFMHLYKAGILKRRAYSELDVQLAALQGVSQVDLNIRFGEARVHGALLHAAFFLGSADFYQWLKQLSPQERDDFQMTSVGNINQLYGNSQPLEQAQRHEARFVNTAMKLTLLGAAASDALDDQRLVSGVGGQYNFVAMAHALQGARSILLVRSGRTARGGRESNIVWSYGHTTIPRHLRDIVVSEYGVADLRGKSDEQVIKSVLAITDSRDQQELCRTAIAAGKLSKDYKLPEGHRHNTPERLLNVFSRAGISEQFPEYPFGSDFTDEELLLLAALRALKKESATLGGKLKVAAGALWTRPARISIRKLLRRMELDSPDGIRERLLRRVLASRLSDD
jgi:acyl-CoA hydrolase